MKNVLCFICVLTIFLTSFIFTYAEETTDCELTSIPTDECNSEYSTEQENTTAKNEKPNKLPEDEYYFGDINNDNYITAADSRLVLKFSSKQILLTERQCVLADANSNKVVNAQDARLILRIAARLDKPKVCSKAASADPTVFITKYDNRKNYKPYVKGFSTNIMDDEVFSQIKALEDYCRQLGNVVTFYFTDVNNEYFIQYNSDRIYRTQCTVKAAYVKSMLDYMEKHNIPLSKTIYLKSSQKWNGHYLSNFRTGTGFTVSELMYYAIRNSDNTAYQMLFDNFGTNHFNENAKKINSSLRLNSYIFGETSASNMAKHYLDIYNYNGKYKDIFFEHLSNSNTSPLIRNGIPSGITVMRKSGSGGNATVGYHDCAIVMAEQPFVLIIYTSVNRDWGYDRTPFRKIAEMAYKINETLTY